MLRIIQRYDRYYSCHLQGGCVVVARFLKAFMPIGQAVGGELDLMVLIGRAGEITNLTI
jgi:hypothetical protein